MEVYRCTKCKWKPILFEGNFIGEVRKICPKCKKMNIFTNFSQNNLEKVCKVKK